MKITYESTSLSVLVEKKWKQRLKKCEIRFLNSSLINQYIKLCSSIAINHKNYNELNQVVLCNTKDVKDYIKKEAKDIQTFVRSYTKKYRAQNSVKWHEIQGKALANPEFQEKLKRLAPNKYVMDKLKEYTKHAEFAHFTAKSLLIGDVIRICIDYLHDALTELKRHKNQWQLPWRKQLTREEYCIVKKILTEELKERTEQLKILHYASFARLKSASKHFNPCYEGIITDLVCLLVENYCLKENQKKHAIIYQRMMMDGKTFLTLHNELFYYADIDIKKNMEKLYWMRPQSEAPITTVKKRNIEFPIASRLEKYFNFKKQKYSKHWWNRGKYFRYQLAQKLAFPIAKINGAIKKLNTETLIGIANRGEFNFFDVNNIENNSTWNLLLETEEYTLTNQLRYKNKLEKIRKKWFKKTTKLCLIEVIDMFEKSKESLNQCYLQFIQIIIEKLFRNFNEQKKESNLLNREVVNSICKIFHEVEKKLFGTNLFLEFAKSKSSLEAFISLDEGIFITKLRQGKAINSLEKDYWIPATNEVTEKDEQYRLKLAEAVSEGIYHHLSSPIEFNQGGENRVRLINNLLDFFYKVTLIARNNAADPNITFLQKKLLEYVSWIEDKIIEDYDRYILKISQMEGMQLTRFENYFNIYENFYKKYIKENDIISSELNKLLYNRKNNLNKNNINIYQCLSMHKKSKSISRYFRESYRVLKTLRKNIKQILFEYFYYQYIDYRYMKSKLIKNLENASFTYIPFLENELSKKQIIITLFLNMLLTKNKIKNIEQQLYYSDIQITGKDVIHQLSDSVLELKEKLYALTNLKEATFFKPKLTKCFNIEFFDSEERNINH